MASARFCWTLGLGSVSPRAAPAQGGEGTLQDHRSGWDGIYFMAAQGTCGGPSGGDEAAQAWEPVGGDSLRCSTWGLG